MTPHRARPDSTVIVLVDAQDKLLRAYGDEARARLTRRILLVLKAATELGIPLLVTEQYPQGLGRTVAEIAEALPVGVKVIEKNSFSCFGDALFTAEISKLRPEVICLLGIETHVCIQQTVFDALAAGINVVLPADGTGSRSTFDQEVALRLMLHHGALVTTVESFVFSLMGSAAHPSFRVISKLVKET